MNPNQKFIAEQGEPFSNLERYRRLVEKLIYLAITRPNISFAVGVANQFMQPPHVDHWNVVTWIPSYIMKINEMPKSLGIVILIAQVLLQIDSLTQDSVSIGGNLISRKSKKQFNVAQCSAEAEYRTMATTTCESVWIKHLLQELQFYEIQPMKLYCDNKTNFHIASNQVFHDKTKHIKIDCHFMRESYCPIRFLPSLLVQTINLHMF